MSRRMASTLDEVHFSTSRSTPRLQELGIPRTAEPRTTHAALNMAPSHRHFISSRCPKALGESATAVGAP
eukprot:3071871-Amphidinium_carterae.1